MLITVEKGICHAIHRHVDAANKYMNDYDKSKES